MKKNKKKKGIYCSIEYFMRHKCNGCKLGRKCEKWNDRNKRNITDRDSNINNYNYKEQK